MFKVNNEDPRKTSFTSVGEICQINNKDTKNDVNNKVL